MKNGVKPMRTEVLRYLIEVDNQHSLSKAARRLYLSKSALSESITQLEKELNVAIFQRTQKGVVTTPAGQQILEQARVVLENVNKLYEISFTAPPLINYASTITFGVGEKFARVGLSESISFMLQKYPDVTFNAINMNASQCLDALSRHEIQFALTACADQLKAVFTSQLCRRQLKYIELTDDPILAAVNRAHPLAKKKYLVANDYKNEKIITYSGTSEFNTELLQQTIYLSTFDNILQLLHDNVGISFFPYSLAESLGIQKQEELVMIPIIDMLHSNFMIFPSDQPPSEVQRLFMMLYKKKFEKQLKRQ